MESQNTESQLSTIEKLTNIAEKKPTVAVAIVCAALTSGGAVFFLHLNATTLVGSAMLAAVFLASYIFIYGTLHVVKAMLGVLAFLVKSLVKWVFSPLINRRNEAVTERKLQQELADRRRREEEERQKIFGVISSLSQRSKLMLFVWLKQGSQTVQVPMNDRDPLTFVEVGLMDQVSSPAPFQAAYRFKKNVWDALQAVKDELLNDPGIKGDVEYYETQIAPMRNIFPWM